MAVLKSIERRGKHLLISVIGIIFRSGKPVENFQNEPHRINKILILRLEQKVGNVVMTTFFPQALKDIFPDSSVDILVHENTAPVWFNNPFVDNTMIFSHKIHLHNPVLFIRFLTGIRRSRYDIVLDCSTPGGFSVSNGLLTRFTGARYRAGFLRGESDKFLNMTVSPDHSKHYIFMMHDLLDLFAQGGRKYRPGIYLKDEEINQARDTLSAVNVDPENSIVSIWVGARGKKQWPLDNFLRLSDMLEESARVKTVLLCGPAEQEMFDKLREKPGARNVLLIKDLRKLAALLRLSSLFISGDAGPMHLAAALDAKTVTIFLQDNFVVYGYEDGSRHRVVTLIEDQDNVDKALNTCIATLQLAETHNNQLIDE